MCFSISNPVVVFQYIKEIFRRKNIYKIVISVVEDVVCIFINEIFIYRYYLCVMYNNLNLASFQIVGKAVIPIPFIK